MELLRRGYTVAKEEGIREFLSKSGGFVWGRSYWKAKQKYWELCSTTTISVQEFQAEFGTSGRAPHSLRIFERGERKMLEDLLSEIDSSDIYWDVGSNLGYHSCFVGQQAETVCFEPSPLVAEQCRQNLIRNDINAPVHEVALSDSTGTTTLSPGDIARAESKPVEVQMECGDDLISEIPQPSVIKMDIEGAEVPAVRGMKKVLTSEECRLFYCEVHPEKISDVEESLNSFISEVENLGFEVEFLHEERDHIKASKI